MDRWTDEQEIDSLREKLRVSELQVGQYKKAIDTIAELGLHELERGVHIARAVRLGLTPTEKPKEEIPPSGFCGKPTLNGACQHKKPCSAHGVKRNLW